MWTLLNASGTTATGIFRTREDAESFASAYLPDIKLKPIQLLLNSDHSGALDDGHLYTWPPPLTGLTIESPVMGKPC